MSPTRSGSSSFLQSSVKKVETDFSGVLGILVGDDAVALSSVQRMNFESALSYLCVHNELFKGSRAVIEYADYSFPSLDSSVCDISLSKFAAQCRP